MWHPVWCFHSSTIWEQLHWTNKSAKTFCKSCLTQKQQNNWSWPNLHRLLHGRYKKSLAQLQILGNRVKRCKLRPQMFKSTFLWHSLKNEFKLHKHTVGLVARHLYWIALDCTCVSNKKGNVFEQLISCLRQREILNHKGEIKKNMVGGMLEQSSVESQMLSLSVLFTRHSHPLRHPWTADPVRDDYSNVWTQEEGKSLNEFHLQKQAWSTPGGGTVI